MNKCVISVVKYIPQDEGQNLVQEEGTRWYGENVIYALNIFSDKVLDNEVKVWFEKEKTIRPPY